VEEKAGENGSYTWVDGEVVNSPGYGGYANVSGRTSGVYYYRVATMYPDYYGGGFYIGYSDPVSVTVNTTPPPVADAITTQAQYTYETRIGDINGDGLQDVLVRRTAGGGTPGDGTLAAVILQRLSNGNFTPIVPSSSQLSVAQGWAAIALHLVLPDFNLDGYIDVILDNLGSYIGGALGQIIVAPGQGFATAPQALVPINTKYTQFATEVANWVEDPTWYSANAPIVAIPIYQYVPYCYYYYDEIGNLQYYCDWYYEFVGYQYVADYSGFDQDGLQLATAFHPNGSGQMIPDLMPGSADGQTVDAVFRRVFNVPVFRGILQTGCSGGVYSYDGEGGDTTQVACVPNLIGEILLAHISTLTERSNWRYLTPGEKAAAVAEGLQIRNINEVRVYNKGYSIFNIASQVMSPNGNIYIGTENILAMPWSEDYSIGTVDWLSVLVHEMTHVFQVRTRGCITVCMYVRAGIAHGGSGYVYMPMDPNKPYYSYNIEQQAEMVQDRFRVKSNLLPWAGINQGVTLAQLNGKIPF
jgi:hypothetical protein